MGQPMLVDEERLLLLHRAGRNATEIAEELDVTVRTVVRHRARLGLAQHNPGSLWRATPEWRARVEALLSDGASLKEIARTTGTNEKTVIRHFRGRGWTLEQSGEHAVMTRRANRLYGRIMPHA